MTDRKRSRTTKVAKPDWDLERHYKTRVEPLLDSAPWILRVTERADRPPPLFIIKQQLVPEENGDVQVSQGKGVVLKNRGFLYGESQRRCLPVIRAILQRMCDHNDVPLELHRFLPGGSILFRGNLPLGDEAGCKVALIFKLQERIKEMDRVELLARRVDRFTREEVGYWFSRTTNFGADANRWAVLGMRIMLAGQADDGAVRRMLEELRSSY